MWQRGTTRSTDPSSPPENKGSLTSTLRLTAQSMEATRLQWAGGEGIAPGEALQAAQQTDSPIVKPRQQRKLLGSKLPLPPFWSLGQETGTLASWWRAQLLLGNTEPSPHNMFSMQCAKHWGMSARSLLCLTQQWRRDKRGLSCSSC